MNDKNGVYIFGGCLIILLVIFFAVSFHSLKEGPRSGLDLDEDKNIRLLGNGG